MSGPSSSFGDIDNVHLRLARRAVPLHRQRSLVTHADLFQLGRQVGDGVHRFTVHPSDDVTDLSGLRVYTGL
jgi:hypothetical protein